ncbi:MAG TPA: RNA 2',3'-cyclic phosphodiesterase [Rhizomicrobium sp.]|jgi:2'-5' RNA ligase|nr:RNA 2',3'-cyclic phosphodiesterase [Rhizomicrobium sp.]
MERLFVGLAVPDVLARRLALLQGGVPGARWQTREQLHLTLCFIGEVDGRDMAMIDDVLAGIDAPGFDLEPHGVGEFGGKHPDVLWAGVRPSEALDHLQRKVETAVRRVGVKIDHSKFVPHITLARMGRGANMGRILDWLSDHALFAAPGFPVTEFLLYSSVLTDDGSVYAPERAYSLR